MRSNPPPARIPAYGTRRHRDLPPLGVEEDLDRYDQPDPTLTPAEATALAALHLTCGKYLRTEQERIPISDAEHALVEALKLREF